MKLRTVARLSSAIASILSLAAGACAGESVGPDGSFGSGGADLRAESVVYEQMVAEPARLTEALMNQYRAARGLTPVQLDPQLEAVAYQQAKAMADRDLMDHNILGDFGSRMKANGVLNVYGGENIGRNIRTADKMFDWWIHSPVHEANIANPRVTRLGFAVVYSSTGHPYWAMAVASQPL